MAYYETRWSIREHRRIIRKNSRALGSIRGQGGGLGGTMEY